MSDIRAKVAEVLSSILSDKYEAEITLKFVEENDETRTINEE